MHLIRRFLRKPVPQPYVYRPAAVADSFVESMRALGARGNKVIPAAIDNASSSAVIEILRLAREAGLEFQNYPLDLAAYREYCARGGYATRFADYYADNRREKSLEHYLALRLLDLGRDDVFIDLASEHSPVPEIYQRLTGADCYRQDIMYPPGMRGKRIGGDACAMPVPEGFATKAALTCSLEHFEGSADTRLFAELARVLQPRGRVCVIPFYLFTEAAVQTDPTVSVPSHVPFDCGATIYCVQGWGNRHGRFYSPLTFLERIVRPVRRQFRFDFYHLSNASALDPSVYARFAFTATRL